MIRVLVINPNTSAVVSDVIRRGLDAMALDDTSITVVNAPFGSEAIDTPAEACIAGHAVLAALADHRHGADAVVVGAFGDPGLEAAASVMSVPVIGTASAAFAEAGAGERRFAIITLGMAMKESIEALVARHGMASRLTGVHFLDAQILDVTASQDRFADSILALARRCIEMGAQAIVLGGAPFTGLGARLSAALAVPVAAGLEAALRQARQAAARPPAAATAPRYSRPTKRFVGLPDNLIGLLKGASSRP